MIKRLRHVGIVTANLDDAVKSFRGFGFVCSEMVEIKQSGLKIAFLPVGDTLIELLNFDPGAGREPYHQVLRSQKAPLNHLCFEVDDLEASIRDFEAQGARLIEGCPVKGAHGRIAFFYPETTQDVLIELCQV